MKNQSNYRGGSRTAPTEEGFKKHHYPAIGINL